MRISSAGANLRLRACMRWLREDGRGARCKVRVAERMNCVEGAGSRLGATTTACGGGLKNAQARVGLRGGGDGVGRGFGEGLRHWSGDVENCGEREVDDEGAEDNDFGGRYAGLADICLHSVLLFLHGVLCGCESCHRETPWW